MYRRLADLLVERGWEVDYLTRDSWSPGAPPETPFRVVPIWRGDVADATGVRRPRAALSFARALHRRLRRDGDYDLIIASALPVLTLLAAVAAVRRRVPVVADWLEVWPLRTWWSYSGAAAGTVAWLLQSAGAWATRHHTVNSPFTAARLRRARPGADAVVLGLVDLVEPTRRTPAASPPYVVSVGRLIADKRFDTVPAALAVARRRIPGLTAVIVGSGPEETAIRSSIVAAGVEASVRLAGRVDDAELADLLGGAAALIHPSRREGFGLVVAEAAAAGVPTVVVDGPDNAAAALIEPGVNGAVVADVDDAELGGALGEALGEVVTAGMRESSGAWFDRERRSNGLGTSLDAVIRRAVSGSAR